MNQTEIKKTGFHLTPQDLSVSIARNIFKYSNFSQNEIVTIMDPSCGEGDLLIAINEIAKNIEIEVKLIGIDTNAHALEIANRRLNKENAIYQLLNEDFLYLYQENFQRDLFSSSTSLINKVDIIISNPPYVRTKYLHEDNQRIFARKLNLSGKVDLYQIFIVCMSHFLKDDGYLGMITSNKYLNNKTGSAIRKFLYENFRIDEIIDLGDTKPFRASVLPALFFGKKNKAGNGSNKPYFRSLYECSIEKNINIKYGINNLEEFFHETESGVYNVKNQLYKFNFGKIISVNNYKEPWVLANSEELQWYSQIIEKSDGFFEDYFKIRVGIKTTADNVFINNWEELDKETKPEEALLFDLISSENTRKWKISNRPLKKILYPHYTDSDGSRKAVNLRRYPKAEKYLNSHISQLQTRKYFEKAGRNWYEIWVPQEPSDWKLPKLVFPDISSESRFLFDDKGYMVNGNCYWMTLNEKVTDIDYLYLALGLSNSKTYDRFHSIAFQNRLYSGKKRYLTQYINRYPMINIKSKEAQIIIECVKLILNSQYDSLDVLNIENEINKQIEFYYDLKQ